MPHAVCYSSKLSVTACALPPRQGYQRRSGDALVSFDVSDVGVRWRFNQLSVDLSDR